MTENDSNFQHDNMSMILFIHHICIVHLSRVIYLVYWQISEHLSVSVSQTGSSEL